MVLSLFLIRQISLASLAVSIFTVAIGGQTIRRVEILGPAVGNSTSGEVAVVNSTGLVYYAGQSAFGGNIGVINPNTGAVVKVIRPANLSNPVTMFYSRVNQAANIVYFSHPATPNAQIVSVDGRPASKSFNQLLSPIVFTNQTLVTFAIDQTRNRLYATTRVNGSNPVQSQVQIVDINPASPTFHQILSTVFLPSGQQVGHIAVNSLTNKVYVATQSAGGGVSYFDGTQQILNFIAGTQPSGPIVVNEISNTVYAGRSNVNSLQAIDGITQTLTTNIAIPASLNGTIGENVAVNSTTERVYAILFNGSLAVIDSKRTSPTFNTAVANIPNVGVFNGEVAVDEGLNKIVVASGNSFTTSIIDGATNTVAGTTQGNMTSLDVTINPNTGRAFVGHSFYTTQVVNLTDNSFVNIATVGEVGTGVANTNNGSFYIGYSSANSGIAFLDQNDNSGFVSGTPHPLGRYIFSAQNNTTNRIYAVNSAANAAGTATSPGFVSVIDAATNAIMANVAIGGQPFADPTVNESTNKIYVQNAGLGLFPTSISVIDGAANTASFVDTTAFPPNTLLIGRIAANPVSNRIYFTTGQGSGTGVTDGATDVATPLPLGPGFTSDILVNKTLNRVYFLRFNELLVLDGTNDAVIANIPLSSASSFAINESNGRIFVTSATNKTLTAIDGNTNSTIATVSLAGTPNSLAVNKLTNRVYIGTVDLANEGNSSIAFIDGGSFTVHRILPVPLTPGRLVVNAVTKTLYATTVNASQRTGIVVISDTIPPRFGF